MQWWRDFLTDWRTVRRVRKTIQETDDSAANDQRLLHLPTSMQALTQEVREVSAVHCSRCGVMHAAIYYDVVHTHWKRFARRGETTLCTSCMWSDPAYIELYGNRL